MHGINTDAITLDGDELGRRTDQQRGAVKGFSVLGLVDAHPGVAPQNLCQSIARAIGWSMGGDDHGGLQTGGQSIQEPGQRIQPARRGANYDQQVGNIGLRMVIVSGATHRLLTLFVVHAEPAD